MELDDLKKRWEEINREVAQQGGLSSQRVEEMTRTRYHSSLRKIIYPELLGILVCLLGAAYVVLKFGQLDTPFLQGVGIATILLLLLLSALSGLSIRQLRMRGDLNKTYREALRDFATRKIRFHRLQRINVGLSYLLLLATFLLLSKLVSGKDMTGNKYFWIFVFSLGFLFLFFYSRWVMKHYRRALEQTEGLLQELLP